MKIVEDIRHLRWAQKVRRVVYARRLRKTIYGQFAFIHINKCGGTSIEAALNLPKTHDTAQQRRDKIGRDHWPSPQARAASRTASE